MKGYISRIRAKIGRDKLIHPAARIIVENARGEILAVEKRGSGKLGLPAGALEEGETIEECIIREVKEETGLDINHLIVIGISSEPQRETIVYPNGDIIQYFTIEFYTNSWSGEITIFDTREISSAKFVSMEELKELPKSEYSAIESLDYFRKEGRIMVK